MQTDRLTTRFRDYLRGHGLALTEQRRRILDHLIRIEGHFDAEELVLSMRRKKLFASRATIYRTLAHLQDAGFIRKIDLDTQHAHFEFVAGARPHHEHLVCEECGEIAEFADPLLEERIERLAATSDFAITRHTVQIFGVCAKCRGRKETQADSR